MPESIRFLRDWALLFAALVSAVSGFVAFLPGVSLTVGRSALIFGICLAVSAALAWQRTRVRQFPIDEFELDSATIHCRLVCPAPRELAEEASALAHRAFGRIPSIPSDRYDSWRLKNPNILGCLVNAEGVLVGYFDVLPLRTTFMDNLIRGSATERDIRHEDILSPHHARKCKRLYLAGVAVRDPQSFAGKRHARHLLWGLTKYLEHFYGVPSERQVYALAGTEVGHKLLKRFSFRMVLAGSSRRDLQDLYMISLNDPNTMSSIEGEIGNWAQACRVSWIDQETASRKPTLIHTRAG